MPKILIIEDELIVAKDIKDVLSGPQWDICGICTRADTAIEQIAARQPDLVLIDVVLRGDKDGTEVGQYLTNRTDIPFVYVTSLSDKPSREKINSTHPWGYVIKPFRSQDVLAAVELAWSNYNRRAAKHSETEESIPYRLKLVTAHIQNNLHQKIRLQDLADLTPWKTAHFIRTFKTYLGTTPYQYILDARIKKAKQLLEETNLPIAHIAFDLGFQSHSAFSVAFQKQEHMTAIEFRKISA